MQRSLDDLVLVDSDDASWTFTDLRTGRTHVADITIGPEGPAVTLRD